MLWLACFQCLLRNYILVVVVVMKEPFVLHAEVNYKAIDCDQLL